MPARTAVATVVLLLSAVAWSAPPAAAPTAPIVAPGLTVTFSPAGGAANAHDMRPSRMLAIYVPEGTPPSAFLPPGPFAATFEGDLNLKLREKLSFSAEGQGKLEIRIGDKVVFSGEGDLSKVAPLEAVRLNKGPNKLVARYESPAQGDSWLRVLWADRSLRFDPIPPTVLTHDPNAMNVAQARKVREGRFLLAELRCTKCHAAPDAAAAAEQEHGFAELAMDAPVLNEIGARLHTHWMAAWVHDPRALRPDAHMPRVFHEGNTDGAGEDTRAADVAAYLATLGAGGDDRNNAAPAAEHDAGKAKAGGVLFASLNCVACHTTPDKAPAPGAADPASRVPLHLVKAKYKPEGLRRYLLNPHGHYAWNPMPDFRLADDEAEALAAYLLGGDVFPVPVVPGLSNADPKRGEQLVLIAGCLNCHTLHLPGVGNRAPAVPVLADMPADRWNAGCLAPDDQGHRKAPDFGLTDARRESLHAFAATDRDSLKRDAAAEFSTRQVTAMRCNACHARDGQESLLATVLADESSALFKAFPPAGGEHPAPEGGPAAAGEIIFAPDQRAPLLTWMGEKLRPHWMASFLAVKIDYKPRPYLRARMPAFTARAHGLAAGLAAEHGCPPALPEPPAPDASLVADGKALMSKAGFSCVQCHAIKDQPPLAPFEAPAVNFRYTSDRLRRDYYDRWVRSPLQLDPNTKMPQFADEDMQTAIRHIQGGDAAKQFDAIWQYLLQGEKMEPTQ